MAKLKLFCIIVLTFFIVLEHYVNGTREPSRIFRDDHDTFDNPTCWTSVCSNCMEMNADCTYRSSGCRECRCSGQYKTYLRHLSTCVRDSRLLFFPVENNSFLIESSQSPKECITFDHVTYNVTSGSCNLSDPSQQWIRTQYNQLLHVETSKCVQQGEAYPGESKIWYLGLEKCNISETKQKWNCHAETLQRIFINNVGQQIVMFINKNIIHSNLSNLILASSSGPPTNWRRYQSMQSENKVCSLTFGCNEFANSTSPMLVLDQHDCQGEQKIAGLSTETKCFAAWNQSQFLDYNDWKQFKLTENIFSFSKRTSGTFLKWDLTKAQPNCSNRIIRLSFYCTGSEQPNPSSSIIKCILIKLKKSCNDPTAAASTVLLPRETTKTSFSGTLKTTNPTNPATYTTSNSNNKKEPQKDESSNVVGIVVGLLVAVLAICGIILGFCIYKRRRGLDKTSSNVAIHEHGKGQSSGNTSNPIYSSADKNNPSFLNDGGIYQEPSGEVSASQACSLYEHADNHEYDYAKVKQTNKPAPISQEQEYDYAKNDDIRTALQRIPDQRNEYSSNVNRKNDDETQKEHDTGPVYQTLECE